MKMKRLTRRFSKRTLIIAAIIALVLITGGVYAYLSYQAWAGVGRYHGASADLKESISRHLGNETTKDKPAEQIAKVLDEFEDRYPADACDVNAFYAWQQFLPGFTESLATCRDSLQHVAAVTDTLTNLHTFYEDQTRTATVLQPVVTATAKPTDLANAQKQWQSVASSEVLGAGHEDFQPVNDKIKEAATAIAAALGALQKADAAKNRTDYDAALEQLDAAYASLGKIDTLALSQRDTLIASFSTAYDSL